MKFGKQLFNQAVPEWRQYYIDYEKLKVLVERVENELVDYSPHPQHPGADLFSEKQFWSLLEENAFKINTFFLQRLDKLIQNFYILQEQCTCLGILSRKETETIIPLLLPQHHHPIHVSSYNLSPHPNADHTVQNSLTQFCVSEIGSTSSQTAINVPYTTNPENYDNLPSITGFNNLTSSDIKASKSLRVFPSHLKFPSSWKKTQLSKHEKQTAIRDLKDAWAEHYRGILMLLNYSALNYLGFRKILKKHEKHVSWKSQDFALKRIRKLEFYDNIVLSEVFKKTETIYVQSFADGNRSVGMKEIRVEPATLRIRSSFYMGFFVAINFVLILWLIIQNITLSSLPIPDTPVPAGAHPNLSSNRLPFLGEMFILYRALGLPILMLWMWAINMYVWSINRVNFAFIFEFNFRRHTSYVKLFGAAAFFSALWFLSLNLYVASSTGSIPFLKVEHPEYHPLGLFFILIFCLFIFQLRNNWWLLKAVGNIFLQGFSPFRAVNFRDFFITDQFTSLAIVLMDIEYFFCWYSLDAADGGSVCYSSINPIVQPIIAGIPLFWRFNQCIRRFSDTSQKKHLKNAGKYFCGLLVVLANLIKSLTIHNSGGYYTALSFWIFFLIVATIYAYYWDIFHDWSLGQKPERTSGIPETIYHLGATRHVIVDDGRITYSFPYFLRLLRLYSWDWYYYFAICSNLLLRLLWTLTISPGSLGINVASDYFTTILAILEVCRRAQWNLFRMENEQVNNCGAFRAQKDVPLPFDFDAEMLYNQEDEFFHFLSTRGPQPLHFTTKLDNRLPEKSIDVELLSFQQ